MPPPEYNTQELEIATTDKTGVKQLIDGEQNPILIFCTPQQKKDYMDTTQDNYSNFDIYSKVLQN